MLLTDFPEGCELLPAGDERAGATEAVTLAGHLHVVDDGLQHDVRRSDQILLQKYS